MVEYKPLISNNCEEFAVTVRSLRDHFNNLMKRCQSKARLEIKGTGLGGEDLFENKQLLEGITDRFEGSKRRSKADTQKRQSISKTKKRHIWREKNVRCKTKKPLGIKTQQKVQFRSGWFLFVLSEKNLSKVANLDQMTCKKKTMKGMLGKSSITSSLYKINKYKLSKVRQFKPCNNSRPRFWPFCFKDSKVVYFK